MTAKTMHHATHFPQAAGSQDSAIHTRSLQPLLSARPPGRVMIALPQAAWALESDAIRAALVATT